MTSSSVDVHHAVMTDADIGQVTSRSTQRELQVCISCDGHVTQFSRLVVGIVPLFLHCSLLGLKEMTVAFLVIA